MADIPVVYTLTVCPACDKLRSSWGRQGIKYEEKRVDQSQDTLDEALLYGDSVPIIVFPDGRVEIGFEGSVG
jgi:glutaredoxin